MELEYNHSTLTRIMLQAHSARKIDIKCMTSFAPYSLSKSKEARD